MDGLDRRDHRTRDGRGAKRRRSAQAEEQASAGLGGTGGESQPASGPKADLLEELAGPLGASAAEPAEELLGAVSDEEQPDRRACQ
jgi:hypothetical protein